MECRYASSEYAREASATRGKRAPHTHVTRGKRAPCTHRWPRTWATMKQRREVSGHKRPARPANEHAASDYHYTGLVARQRPKARVGDGRATWLSSNNRLRTRYWLANTPSKRQSALLRSQNDRPPAFTPRQPALYFPFISPLSS